MTPDSTSFAGQVALVTGGAGGIGAATVRELARRGAHVVVADLPGAGAEALANEVSGSACSFDVASEEGWADAVAQIDARHGRLDVLVNAAGIVGDVVRGTLEATTLADWRRVLAINLDGTFLGCRAAMPLMRRRGQGAIVNVASVGAYYPTTQSVAYGASKGAVTQFSKSVAAFGAQGGLRVRCNSVHPGRTDTPMLDHIVAQRAQRPDGAGSIDAPTSAARIPLGPAGTPADVAALIAFLASDQAAYITGAEFVVDGGWSLLR